MTDFTPEEIYEKIKINTDHLPAKIPGQENVTRSTERLDDSIRTIEDKIVHWQEIINNWRITILQNERAIIIFYALFGFIFAYAINECTGDLDFPLYAYILVGIIMMLMALLQIPEGGLRLIIILKYSISMMLGHYSMMMFIAIDGHTIRWFTTDVCRYPATSDFLMGIPVGGAIVFLAKSYEEIKLKSKKHE